MQTTVSQERYVDVLYRRTVTVRAHELRADDSDSDTAPGPHDFFIASLASCTAMTAMWYAKRHGIPLERADARVVADNTEERAGVYKMRVDLTFFGPLSDDQRATLRRAMVTCPIHKLMTTADVQIELV